MNVSQLQLRSEKFDDDDDNNNNNNNSILSLSILHSYLFTLWKRVLLEKLTVPQLIKNFFSFYGTRRFITAFIRVHHLSLS